MRIALLAGLALVGTACRARAPAPGFGHDSAGVTIVADTGARDPGDFGRLDSLPTLDFDSAGALARHFGRIVGLVRIPGGSIAVADGATGTIDILGADGRVLQTLGGRGDGLGEFRALSWLTRRGRTLIAFDEVTRRLTLFDSAGRTHAITLPEAPVGFTMPVGFLRDGALVAALGGPPFPFPGPPGTARRDSALMVVLGADGLVRDSLGMVPWDETFGVPVGRGPERFLAPVALPFGRATVVAVAGDRIVIGTADRYEIREWDSRGRLRRIIRLRREGGSVTPALVDSLLSALRHEEGGGAGTADSLLRVALRTAPLPGRRPPYTRLLADSGGNLWVMDDAIPGTPTRWQVLDSSGRWLGGVTMPPGFDPAEIGVDWVLGRWRSPTGEEHVRMYRLERGGRSL